MTSARMLNFRSAHFRFAVLAACASAVACGKSGPTESRKATRIEVLAGDAQTAGVGTTIAVTVRTSDTQGAIGGVAVLATPESPGGGSASRERHYDADGTAKSSGPLGGKLGSSPYLSSTVPRVRSRHRHGGPPESIFATTEVFRSTRSCQAGDPRSGGCG